MYKLGYFIGEIEHEHSHPPVYATDTRILAGVPGGDSAVFEALTLSLEPPYYLLYVLHTPRTELEAGRYQSPPLSAEELRAFLKEYSAYLAGDSRFDLWAHSPNEQATIVWDRHNLLFGYGPLERYESVLASLGFEAGQPEIPTPHIHHFRPEFDSKANQLLKRWAWERSPLQPEDEQ